MRTIILYLTLSVLLFASKAIAQDDTFTTRTRDIAARMKAITKEEKAALKEEIESVNRQLENGTISTHEADLQKQRFAEVRAKNIETRVAEEQDKLDELVRNHVDGKLKDTTKVYGITFRVTKNKDSIRAAGEQRTTSQFVFAFGLNHLETNNSIAHSDYKVWGSHFYEWGVTWNTRLAKNHNLLHAKYGLSLMYNNLRPTDNRYFLEDGKQTVLVESDINLKESRFRNVYIVAPVHLEFDFTKPKTNMDGKKIFRTHDSFRMGIGGYVGGNIKSKQILKFRDENNNRVRQVTHGDYNVNDFIYGLSAYIGYGEVSLYAKYDLQPLFENNAVDQRNISLGVRFDLN